MRQVVNAKQLSQKSDVWLLIRFGKLDPVSRQRLDRNHRLIPYRYTEVIHQDGDESRRIGPTESITATATIFGADLRSQA
jgi:hypothetical protein